MDDEETSFPFAGFRSWEMVSSSYHDCFIFPPNLHEGLHIHSNPDQTLDPSSPSPQQQIKEREKEEQDSGADSKQFSISAHRVIVSWFRVFRSKVSGRCGGSADAIGVWVCSFAALAGFLMYLRRRWRREKEFLLFLIREKNQKIGLLLHQIAELNAVLAAHRKVPVLKRT